ncbi:ABC transporter substrate-binding protein [bacterium]|nr:ABC transporter substrate-binding protein [bacterium]
MIDGNTHRLTQLSTRVLFKAALCLLASFALLSCDSSEWNNPYPESQSDQSIIYSSFTERPKHLDPGRSYSQSEYIFLGQIYEPPLQYHYLKRPYELIPQTLTDMPSVSYLDANAQPLTEIDRQSGAEVGFTEYHFSLQKNIRYQPHPALSKNDQGEYLYHSLSLSDAKTRTTLADFEQHGTRELTAHDYAYQIKRLASPETHSPITGLMKGYIVGLEQLSTELNALSKTLSKTMSAEGGTHYIDLREHELSGVTVEDDHHYSIRIKGEYPQFLYWLAMPFFAPMPWEAEAFYHQPGLEDNNINLDWYPIGTGAYYLTENNPNLRMTLEKNPNFHGQTYPKLGSEEDKAAGLLADAGKPLPFIDKVIFTLEGESIPYWNKFLQGYYDVSSITSDSFDSAVNFSASGDIALTDDMRAKGIELSTVVNTTISYLGFNMLDPVVGGSSDRARYLRQAISVAVDYDEFIAIFANGRGIAGQSPIPPGIFGYQEGELGINPYVYQWENGQPVRHGEAKAQELMSKAGYTNGIDPNTGKALILYYESVDSGPDGKARINWLRKQFKKIGIQLIIRPTNYNRFREKMSNGDAQIYNWGWNADYPDPENFLFLLYSKQGKVKHKGENASNYSNPEFDRLFESMKNMQDSPERQAIISQMLDILRYDAPWSFGFHPKSFTLNHAWYDNHKPFTMTNTGTLKYKRIDIEARNLARSKWNKPVIWPIVFVIIAILLLLLPAYLGYRRHQRARAI